MKNKYQFIGMCLFFLAISLAVISCSVDEDLEENQFETELNDHAEINANNGRAIGGGGGGVTGGGGSVGFDSYFTWIRCSSNGNGIVELKAHYKEFDQCMCLTNQWEYNNCDGPAGSEKVYNRCTSSTSPNTPIGALCSN